jgi:hypothetical protein
MPNEVTPGELPALPEELTPALPEGVNASLFAIGEAIGSALRLAGGQGAYDEQSGEPLDSDAETETHALRAQERLEHLADKIEGWQKGLVAHALEAYKDHLYYDATAGFEYSGLDEEVRGTELQARFETAYELARTLAPGLDKAALMEHGLNSLVEETREKIPELRAEASREYRNICPAEPSTPEGRQKSRRAWEAVEALREKEEVLDLLLYHLENPSHAEYSHQSGEAPAPGPPRNYAVVLYYPGEDPERGAGAILSKTSTEEVARLREADLGSGLPIDLFVPPRAEIEAGTLAVEKIEPSYDG